MLKEKRMDVNFRRRLQRKLYYGDLADLDTPSLPLTELAVDYFRDSVPEKLGHVDLYTASNVIKRNRVSPCSMVLSMLYAKRLRQQKQRSKEYLQTMSSSDVFFISMMMASKYLYDEGVEEEVFNDEWADNSDQDVDDVNQMEIDFLQAMDWKLFVRPHEFEETLSAIERRLALQEGLKRGWFTYTEMDILMDMDLMRAMWWHVGAECSKLVTAISAAYLTSLLSMVGSTALALHISGPLSSGTIALFTLQASPFGYSISAGLPSLSSVSFSTSLGLGMSPSSVRYKDTTKKNESELKMAASVLDRELGLENGNGDTVDDGRKLGLFIDALSSRNDASTGNDRNASGDDGGGGGGGDGLGSGRYADGCGGKRGDGDGHSTRSTNPSWWSLWFLDSLLSQLWAIASIKSKLTHSGGESILDKFSRWSCSSKDSDRSCQSCGNTDDDSSDRQKPCFRRRQREMKHHHNHWHCVTNPGTRNIQTNSRTTVHPCGLDSETSEAARGLCQSGRVTNEDQVCSSCGANRDRPTHPWCNWPCRSAFSTSQPVCDFCSSLSLNQPNCEPPLDNHIRANPTSLASSCNKNPCPCGAGVGMSVNLPRHQNREPHFSHAVAALDPPEELMKRPAILPQLESSYELLRVPLGFFTSISQVLQAA